MDETGQRRRRLSDAQRARLASRVRQGSQHTATGITRRPAGSTRVPLSFGQEQLWFLDQYAPGRPTYNLPGGIRLDGELDVAALRRAVEALLARHEALRTRLVTDEDGRPVQVVDPPGPVDVPLLDYSAAGPDTARDRLAELARAETARPFDLARGPLLRTHLVRLAEREHVLLTVVHHAVFDGWSHAVLLGDLAVFYGAAATGASPALDELPVQFADYALWERDRLRGEALAELEGYWRGALSGFETLQLPTDRPRPALDTDAGDEEFRPLPADLLADLRELSRRSGTTLFSTLLAALQALLSRYTGQTDIVVGTVSANRSRAALTPLIGYLVNTLPIRTDLSGDPTFRELLGRVHEATLGAYAHQDLPFAKLVDTLQVERDPSRAPVFQVTFSQIDEEPETARAAGVRFGRLERIVPADTSKFDLTVFAATAGTELTLAAQYATALFDAATVRRLLGHLETLLRGVVADPQTRLSRLPVLTPSEHRWEVAECNDTAVSYPGGVVHDLIAAQAARTPDAVAVQYGDERVDYAELNRWANRIARRLRGLGIGPESLVGVCMRTDPRRLAGLLGILKAGGAYVPLDPELPTERLSFMMTDADLAAVLTDEPSRPMLPPGDAPVVCLDDEWQAIGELPDTDLLDVPVTPSNAAYVIYTSGSTGAPKGVVVEHRNLVNHVRVLLDRWHIGAGDAILRFASLNFDASVMDIFPALAGGARLVLAPPEVLHSPPRLAALMRRERVTFACLPPAVLTLLVDEQFTDLRLLLSGGEELPTELARAFCRRPGLEFSNAYGPTETTVTATLMRIGADTPPPPPIGLPLTNYRAYVLDARLNPVPVGVVGELHIGGVGVARGYLNRPELTAQRFIEDPFVSGGRLYKTGDLVRRRADGTIVFVGRADTQVKIRGLRVELGEIEATLTAHPAVAQAVVTVRSDRTGEKELVAYLRAVPDAAPQDEELRAHLARTLPAYMIPTHLVTLTAFPLTTSGKIDRAALPTPTAATTDTEELPPATSLESTLIGLYAGLLDRERVGVTDSFFHLGGNSLRAMRLVSLISTELGVDIGATDIFLHPTPRRLAARIDALRAGTGRPDDSDPLVELSRGIGRAPLFLVHPVGGTVFAYAQLARELAETFSVSGIEAPGLREGGSAAETLDELVIDYVTRIRAAQPTGPYRLGGWSMGGVLAFEIARRLERDGAQVALLILLDAPFVSPDGQAVGTSETALAAGFVADATRSLGWDAAETADPAAPADQQLRWLADRLGDQGMLAGLRRRFDIFQAHSRMVSGYRPDTPAVRAPALIVSADASPNAPARQHWPRVLDGPVETVRVAGDHYTFLQPPLVTEVAASIMKCHSGHVSVATVS